MSCQEKTESFGRLDYSSNSDVFFSFLSFFFVPMGCWNERLRGTRWAGGHMWGSSRRSLQSVSLGVIQSIWSECRRLTPPQSVSVEENNCFWFVRLFSFSPTLVQCSAVQSSLQNPRCIKTLRAMINNSFSLIALGKQECLFLSSSFLRVMPFEFGRSSRALFDLERWETEAQICKCLKRLSKG